MSDKTAFTNRSPSPRLSAPPVATAGVTWLGAWLVGQLLSVVVITIAGVQPDDPVELGVLVASSMVLWTAFLVALFMLHRYVRAGSGTPPSMLEPLGLQSFRDQYGLDFRRIDLLGAPIGVATQLVVVPLLYWPLRALWQDTFTNKALERRAEEIVDAASGTLVIVLALVLVVGAPLFEELMYRGLIQRSLVARLGRGSGVVLASVFFGVIHFAPVELPGLIVAGLVFGTCAAMTGRIGMSIVAHAAFNATALAVITVFD